MIIAIGNDHHGVKLKKEIKDFLVKDGHKIIDIGTDTIDIVDYPLYAFKVANLVKDKKADLGILLCGTGIGMSIAANKIRGIRCAKIDNLNDARLAKEHNNANVLALSSNLDFSLIKNMILTFIKTEVNSLERYKKRNDMLDNYRDDNNDN